MKLRHYRIVQIIYPCIIIETKKQLQASPKTLTRSLTETALGSVGSPLACISFRENFGEPGAGERVEIRGGA